MMRNFVASLFRARTDNRERAEHSVSALLMCALALAPAANAQIAPVTESAKNPTESGKTETVAAKIEASPRPSWKISPSVSVEGTYTDNVSLTPNKKADFVTRLSPGITLDGKSGRASASLNYQWQHYSYAENSALSNQQRTLVAKGQLELVEQWLFLDGSHNIAQKSVSAFGKQSVGNELINSNRSETAAYSISPYIKGRLASVADYQLRYTGTHTRADSGALAGGTAATTRAWNAQLTGAAPLALLRWSLSADQQTVRNSNNFDSHSDHVSGTLTYQIDPQIRLQASLGRESDNFTSVAQRSRTTSGVGLDWAPTERTSVSLKKDRNAAGNAHSVNFSHRTALSAWKFSDSRSITIPTPQMALASSGTAYDLLNLQLASSFPDSAERAAEVNRQLEQTGIAADAPIFGSLMTSQAFVQTRQQASVALNGANNTVVFAADRSNSERIGAGVGLADDFAQNSSIRQAGFNTSWAHKLTPHASLTLNASKSRSTGSANVDTSTRAWSLSFNTRLGAKTSASVGLRQSRFDSSAGTGYDEQALLGAMQLKF